MQEIFNTIYIELLVIRY